MRTVIAAAAVLLSIGCGREIVRTESSVLLTPSPTPTPSPTISPVPTEPPLTATPAPRDDGGGRPPHRSGEPKRDDDEPTGGAAGGPGIRGVVSADGRPVAHVNVSVKREGFHTNVTTNRRGRFVVEASEGTYDVTVTGEPALACETERVAVGKSDWTKVAIDCERA